MEYSWIVLALGGFIASFINSIVGGGGLISVPVLLLLNIPPHTVLGTNKLAATFGAVTSAYYFVKKKKVNFSILKYLTPFTFLGAFLGVNAVTSLGEKFLYIIAPCIIIILSIYTYYSKSFGYENRYRGITKNNVSWGILLAFSLGFYDGFFGPGTGIFLIFGMAKIFKLDFIFSSGNAKILNFVSNMFSLILFAMKGHMIYSYGIFMAVFMIFGGLAGSYFVIKKGNKFIKPIFLIMSIASALGIVYSKLL